MRLTRRASILLFCTALAAATAVEARAQSVRCSARDDFSSNSFANQDGTIAWSGPWIELDPAGAGPAGGNALITFGELSLDDFSNTNIDIGVERELDLSAYSAAQFRFAFRTTSGVDSNDAILVDVSSDGGASWTLLERITGISGAVSATRTYDISPHIAPDTRIRLRVDGLNGSGGTTCCYGASGENFLIDFVEVIVDATCSTDHFAIVHDGLALSCGVEPITIERHDGSHDLDSGYSGTIEVAVSSGNGVFSLQTGSGTFVDLGGGRANYTFAPADAGRVVLGLTNLVVETVDLDVFDGSVGERPDEDPPLAFTGGVSATFRDEFSGTSYSGDDGTQVWSTPWLEINEFDGPGLGDEQVRGILRVRNNDGGGEGVLREADLSAYTSAELRFEVWRQSLENSGDYVRVDVSDDGGSTWTELDRFQGPANDSSFQLMSYDLTPWLSSDTRIRFLSSPDLSDLDAVFFDNVEIEALAPAACGPDHFSISHDGDGVNCQAEAIVITAHDALHNVDAAYSDAIALSTSTGNGDWSLFNGAGTLNNAGGGNAVYQFDLADNGVVTLGLLDTFSESLSVNVVGGTVSEAVGEDPGLQFHTSGFQFLADGTPQPMGVQIAGKPSDTAPGAQTLELQAVRTNTQTGACEVALQGDELVSMGFRCLDPSSCSGVSVLLNGVALPPSASSGALSTVDVDLDFGDQTDASAPIAFSYDDVGRIELHAWRALSPSGETLRGASAPFVVRPFAFDVEIPGNPAASTPSGARFLAAGEDFLAELRAVLWRASDDLDRNGLADGHSDLDPTNNAALGDNPTTPSFGNEQNPEALRLSSTLVAPAGGNDPGLAGATLMSTWSAGSGSSGAIYFDDVGAIEIAGALEDGDYLGTGAAASAALVGRSGAVGRFSPDHFDAAVDTTPSFATTCAPGSFSYLGQHFFFATQPVTAVTARSAQGTQTRNYRGAWWKLDNASLPAPLFSAAPTSPAALDLSGLPLASTDPLIVDLGDGAGTLTHSVGSGLGSGLRFDRGAAVAPFAAEIALAFDIVDADGVAYASNPFRYGMPSAGNGIAWSAGKTQRYGRLSLANAYGSELSPLPQALHAEYWTGLGFALHGDDVCTNLDALHVGTSARSPGLLTDESVANSPLVSGDAGLVWNGANQEGFADVVVHLGDAPLSTPFGVVSGADLPYLRWDWTGDGAGAPLENPRARLEFGIFSHPAPVIFRREVY